MSNDRLSAVIDSYMGDSEALLSACAVSLQRLQLDRLASCDPKNELGMFVERRDVRIGNKFEGWDRARLIEHAQNLAQQLAIEDKREKDDAA